MAGIVSRLYLRPSARTPVKETYTVTAVAGRGLEGDHAGGGARQVTIMSEESWAAACAELGRTDLEPKGRRANIVVRGAELADSIGGGVRLGDCLLRIVGELRPCRLMDDYASGLQRALEPDMRGGVYGRVLVGGEIGVGDPVVILRAADFDEHVDQLKIPFKKGTN